jgi:hypothetical protein
MMNCKSVEGTEKRRERQNDRMRRIKRSFAKGSPGQDNLFILSRESFPPVWPQVIWGRPQSHSVKPSQTIMRKSFITNILQVLFRVFLLGERDRLAAPERSDGGPGRRVWRLAKHIPDSSFPAGAGRETHPAAAGRSEQHKSGPLSGLVALPTHRISAHSRLFALIRGCNRISPRKPLISMIVLDSSNGTQAKLACKLNIDIYATGLHVSRPFIASP